MACEEKCFSFTWKIENVYYWLNKDDPILSPNFVVDSIDETEWCLGIYPRGQIESRKFVGFGFYRSANSKGGDNVSVKFELVFLAKDGSVLTPWRTVKKKFPKNVGYRFLKFARREDVFTKRSAFLQQDTLTARCRMWKCDGKMAEDVRCFARTRVPVKKRSFLWNIKDFSTLECGGKYTYEIKSFDDDHQLLSLCLLFPTGLGRDEIITCQVNIQDQDIKFSTLALSLVDISGNKAGCNREEFWFDDGSKSEKFKFFFTMNELMAMKSSYLPNDVLSMDWHWVFSKGDLYEEIEPVQYASKICENESFNTENVYNQNTTPIPYSLNENLKSLYDEKFLCDVELKTNTNSFYAHKVVLSASSSVFKAMFSSDMKEKHTSSVNIEDLGNDTIGRMLAYIYTARIEDLTWERASLLYAAADKYAISSLKNVCSSYIKDNLSPNNACEILLLSEIHADDDLKSFV